MDAMWKRLREERERLGMSQTALGEIGGVLEQAQIKYESGARKPDAGYLAAVAEVGIDVLYVITGARSSPGAEIGRESAEMKLDRGKLCEAIEAVQSAIDAVDVEVSPVGQARLIEAIYLRLI